ncbi:hypothetical protein [Roseibium hamelinense]|nr:hypothetical protein [Roseibium hamelinense]
MRSCPIKHPNIAKQQKLLGIPQPGLTRLNRDMKTSPPSGFNPQKLPLREYKDVLDVEIKQLQKSKRKQVETLAAAKKSLALSQYKKDYHQRAADHDRATILRFEKANVHPDTVDLERESLKKNLSEVDKATNGIAKALENIKETETGLSRTDDQIVGAKRQRLHTLYRDEFIAERKSTLKRRNETPIRYEKASETHGKADFGANINLVKKQQIAQLDLLVKSHMAIIGASREMTSLASEYGRTSERKDAGQWFYDKVVFLVEKAGKEHKDPDAIKNAALKYCDFFKNDPEFCRLAKQAIPIFIRQNGLEAKGDPIFRKGTRLREDLFKLAGNAADSEYKLEKTRLNAESWQKSSKIYDGTLETDFEPRPLPDKNAAEAKTADEPPKTSRKNKTGKTSNLDQNNQLERQNNRKKLIVKSDWQDRKIMTAKQEFKALLDTSADIDHELNDQLRTLVEAEYQKCQNIENTLPTHDIGRRIKAQGRLLKRMNTILDRIYSNSTRTKRNELHVQGRELLNEDRQKVRKAFRTGVSQIPHATHTSHGKNTITIGQNQGNTYDVPAYLKDEITDTYSGLANPRPIKQNQQIFDASGNIPGLDEYPDFSHGTRFNLRNMNNDAPIQNLAHPRLVTDTHESHTVSSLLDDGSEVAATSITLHVQDDNNNGQNRMCGTVHLRYNSTPSGRTVNRNMQRLGYDSLNDFNKRPDCRMNKNQLAERKMERKLDALDKMKGRLDNNPAFYARALKDTLLDAVPNLNWDKPADVLNDNNPLAVRCLKGIPDKYLKHLGLNPKEIKLSKVEHAFDQIVDKTNAVSKGLED